MSGKQHSSIGVLVALIGSTSYLYSKYNSVDLLIVVPVTIGALIGSLIPDIDTKKSKASQKFTAVITTIIWIFILNIVAIRLLSNLDITSTSVLYMAYLSVKDIAIDSISAIESNFGLLLMGVITTLGKLSPHRQFTHKWFGALLFCTASIIAFNSFISTGFIIGYILHLLADKTTRAGLKVLEFRLPLCDKNNKLNINY